MKATLRPIGFALFVLILFNGCIASKMTIGHTDKWVPKDFNPKKDILLVGIYGSKGNRSDVAMRAYMKKKYPYKYEFVPTRTIKGREGKYADTMVYRYALVWSTHSYQTARSFAGNGTRMGGESVTGHDLNFVDRALNKEYPRTKRGGSFPKAPFKMVINTLVKKYRAGS